VKHEQLLKIGIGRRAINHRIECGRLHAIFRGVYAVGHRIVSPKGRRIAAVLASGPDAVLSHRAAAAHLDLGRSQLLEVTAPSSRRGRSKIIVHHLPLPADEMMAVDGIPVTTVPRTLFDLAAVLPRAEVERAVNEAEIRHLTDPLSLWDLLERYPRRHGAPTVRAVLADLRPGGTLIRSRLEARFQRFVRSRRLPVPEFNVDLLVAGRWYEPDCIWRPERLIVELDSRAVHATARAFESDRVRDRRLQAAGWHVVRITWRQLREDGDSIALDLKKDPAFG
jgi:very-short-patch-repair endonuclease